MEVNTWSDQLLYLPANNNIIKHFDHNKPYRVQLLVTWAVYSPYCWVMVMELCKLSASSQPSSL